MQPHEERVIQEKQDLDAKIDKLTLWLEGDRFKALPEAEKDRQRRQWSHMMAYSNVLGERIAAF